MGARGESMLCSCAFFALLLRAAEALDEDDVRGGRITDEPLCAQNARVIELPCCGVALIERRLHRTDRFADLLRGGRRQIVAARNRHPERFIENVHDGRRTQPGDLTRCFVRRRLAG